MTSTKITQQDLKLFFAENNRDTEDGGGLRTGKALTGKDNELFPPVGNQSNALGNLAMRLIYAGVDRNDAEPLLEGGFIIAKPPINPHISYLAFAAAYNGELRKDAVKRLEAYSIKTINSRMTLLSQQTQGSRMVMVYQMPDEPLPKVGEVYCLDQEKTGYPTLEEYIKIRKIDTEVRQFYANGKYFSRRVIKIEITNPLRANYQGAENPSEEYQRPPCILRETMVADAGKYYGVKRLAQSINGAVKNIVKVPSIFDRIIPSSQIATPLSDWLNQPHYQHEYGQLLLAIISPSHLC